MSKKPAIFFEDVKANGVENLENVLKIENAKQGTELIVRQYIFIVDVILFCRLSSLLKSLIFRP